MAGLAGDGRLPGSPNPWMSLRQAAPARCCGVEVAAAVGERVLGDARREQRAGPTDREAGPTDRGPGPAGEAVSSGVTGVRLGEVIRCHATARPHQQARRQRRSRSHLTHHRARRARKRAIRAGINSGRPESGHDRERIYYREDFSRAEREFLSR
jgi:hypothetical protein